MATGLANSTTVPETLAGERIIRTQLGRAGRYVKWVEAGSQLLTLSIGILLFFLTAALIDHWLFSLGWAGRWLFCLALVGGSGWFIARRLLPLLVRAVNPTYSARAIEEATPSLKNSLINFLLLKDNHAGVKESVIDALEQRAAQDISTIEVETTIDREPLIRMGYVLCGVLSVVALYKIASPKDPFQTAARVIAPWADLARPSRVIISEVQPGHTSVYLGSQVEVTADVQGARGSDGVKLIYSSADGQVLDRVIEMKASAGGRKFTATLPAEDAGGANSKTSDGLQQGVQYHIEAGDAVSSIYEIRVRMVPTIAVAKAELNYPAYTLKAATTQETGEIKALEGTRVTIHAHANQPIKTAFLELDPRPGRAAETIPLQVDGQQASGSFTLLLKPDRVSPWRESYQVRFTNELGEISEQPVVHRLEVTPDLPPEVEILAPRQQRIDLPEDGQLTIEVRGVDPDFALAELFVAGKSQGQPLFRQSVLPAGESRSQASGKFEFMPAKLNLKAGTVVTYQGVAIDNRRDPLTGQPQPSRAETVEYAIHIVPPPRRNPNDANQAPQPNNQPNDPNQRPNPAAGNEQPKPMPGEKPPMNPAGENPPPMPGEQKPPMPGENPPQPKPGEENQQQKPKKPQDEPKQGGQKSGDPSSGQSGSGTGEASKGQGNQPQPGQGQGGQNNGQPGDKPPMPGEGQTGQDAGQSGTGQSQPGQSGSKTQDPNGAQPPPSGGGNTPGNPNAQGADPGNEGNPEGTPGEQTGQPGGSNAQPGSGKPQHDGEIIEKVMEKLRDQLKENQKKEGAGKGQTDKPQPGEQQPNNSADPAGQNQPGNPSQANQPGGKPTPAKPGAGNAERDPEATEQLLKDIEKMLEEQQAKGQPKPGDPQAKPNETAQGDQADPMGAGQKPMPGQPMPMPGQPMGAGQQGTPQNGAGQKPEATKSGSPQGPPRTDEGIQPTPAQGEKKEPGAGKNGDPGAGDQSGDPTGSGKGQEESRDKPKEMKPGSGSPPKSGEPSAPSTTKKTSDSKGGESGDRDGGGKQGAGQSGGQQGNDSAGGSSPGDEGAGAAKEQGKGETGSKAGKGPEAAGKTGEAGNKPGQGSATKPGQDGNETGKGGESGKQPGKKGENEPGGSNAGGDRAGPGGATGGGAGDRSGQGITKSSADIADEANLNYTRKATDLVLQHLRDQEHNPDPELAKKVQLTPQELQEFARRWSQLKKDAETDPNKARELDEALRSLGMKDPQNRRRSGGSANDKIRDLRDTGSRTQAPNKYREQFDKFRKAAGQ